MVSHVYCSITLHIMVKSCILQYNFAYYGITPCNILECNPVFNSIQYRPSVYRLPLIFVHSDMSNTLQQLGKDLSRFTRGEEPATQTLPQSQKKTSSSSTHHGHYRSAAELEEDREPIVGDWAWQGNKRCVCCILSPTHSAHL